jgi:hypothetical protein
MSSFDEWKKQNGHECKCEKFDVIYKEDTNGGCWYYRQCINCFKIIWIKGSDIKSGKFTVNKYTLRTKEHDQKAVNYQKNLVIKYSQYRSGAFNAQVEEMKKAYHEYLDSDQWSAKREMCLTRDNHLCQGCLNAKATIAHHLTYHNVTDELLFQLISVCQVCHDKIHKNNEEKQNGN